MLDRLENLGDDERVGIYTAPLQMKANNGVLIIDDFGRQRPTPLEILNRWIVPLESGFDILSLHTGKKFRVPFDQLLSGNETVASSGPVMGPHTLIRDELELGFERVLLEGLDPATMIDDLEATANELLADYARRTGR